MGLSLKKITRQINLKNVSPVARVVSIVKPTAQKVIETKNIGIKDVLAISPLGLASNLTNTGVSTITDVVVDKPLIEKPEVDNFAPAPVTPAPVTPAPVTPAPVTQAVAKPEVKKKPNTLMYAGIGVGVLVLGYFGYKLMKK
jgi:hypothetical protein